MQTKIRPITLLLAAVVLTIAFMPAAEAISAQDNQQGQFQRRSRLILDNHQGALTVDKNTKHARFDRGKLRDKNIAADDIVFLQEFTNFSNDVVDTSRTDMGIEAASTKLGKYPKVKDYFKQATALTESGQTLSLRKKGQSNPLATLP